MTLWFRALVLCLCTAAAVGIHRWRTIALRRRNRELDARVNERTRQLQEANHKLEYHARYDALTGLLNRRTILEKIESELGGQDVRPHRQFGCALLDLNRFKQVNDTLGHPSGDAVLREMSRKISDCLRSGDILARLGGDEFLVLLPAADLDSVKTVCGRIADLACVVGEQGHEITVTVSTGAIVVPSSCRSTVEAVLAHADLLLYRVKAAGRRGFQVETAQEQPVVELRAE